MVNRYYVFDVWNYNFYNVIHSSVTGRMRVWREEEQERSMVICFYLVLGYIHFYFSNLNENDVHEKWFIKRSS